MRMTAPYLVLVYNLKAKVFPNKLILARHFQTLLRQHLGTAFRVQ